MPSSAGMAIISTTTSATPAPTPSSTPCAVWTSEQPVDIHNDFYQAEQAWSAIRPLQKPHLPIYFGGSSEAPSPSPANMPTSSRCGASRWRKPARPSSGCAPKRRNTSVISASASRSGRLSPTAKPKHGRKPSISCTSPPSRRRSAGRVQSQTGEHRRPAAAGYRGAGQSGGQTPVDRHRPAGGRRT